MSNDLGRYNQDSALGSTEKCFVPIRDLSTSEVWFSYGSFYINPGYDSFSQVLPYRHASQYPPDRYATSIKINNKTFFRVVVKNEMVPIPAKQRPILKRLFSVNRLPKDAFEEHTYYQLQILANDSYVWASPAMVPDYLLAEKDLKRPIQVTNDIIIHPDYSNIGEGILTTPDMFGIKICEGSEVLIATGGQIGNVLINVLSGKIILNCNPDIQITDCLTSVDAGNIPEEFLHRTLYLEM